MRIIALLVSLSALCALSEAAIARIPACKSVSGPTERLACYDKASPVERPAARTGASNPPRAEPSKYVDTISAEDARMNARLNSICRGC